jgi:hypothetical protein
MKESRLIGALCAALLLNPSAVQAADFTWNCSSSFWWNTGCWSPNGTPGGTDNVWVNTIAATDPTFFYASTLRIDGSATANWLIIDADVDTNVQLIQSAGSSLTVANEVIGNVGAGSAEYWQHLGAHTISGQLSIGDSESSNGRYVLQGGTLTVGSEFIGARGTGIFDQREPFPGAAEPVHTVTYNLHLGNESTGDGTYNLSFGTLNVGGNIVNGTGNGTLNIDGGTLNVGGNIVNGTGTGTLNIDGGTLSVGGGNGSIDVDFFSLGSAVGANGSHTLSGTGSLAAVFEQIGVSGTGDFTQTGGTNAITFDLHLGSSSTGDGTYNLSGGTFNVDGNILNGAGTSTINIDGGTLNVGMGNGSIDNFDGNIYNNGAGTSTINIDGGTLNVGWGNGSIDVDTLTLGAAVNTNGNHTLSGTGSLKAGTVIVGGEGTGVFIQTGGTHTAGSLSGKGDYQLVSGNLTVGGNVFDSTETFDIDDYSGNFTQTGGVHTIANSAHFALGTYTLQGGSLNVGGDILASTLNLDGGTLTVGHDDVDLFPGYGFVIGGNIYAGTLTVGNTATASYTLAGRPVIKETYVEPIPDEETVVANLEIIGGSGTGTFTQTGGLHAVGNLSLATEYNGTGSYNLSGGNLNAFSEFIGESGTGTFTQTGGTHTVSYTNITPGLPGFEGARVLGYDQSFDSGGNLVPSTGSYHLSGGDLVADREIVGDFGTGTFTQTGGTNTVGDLSVGSTGSSYNLSGGTLDAYMIDATAPGSQFNFTGGTLSVDAFNGNLVNDGGTLTPGNSPGATFITGDYTQLFDGTFEVEIGGLFQGTEYDWLDVSGSATLGGALNVSLFDLGSGLFNPSLGYSFDILTADTIIGEFDLLTLALLGGGLKWDVSYILDDFSTDFVRLSVVSAVPVPSAVWLFGSGLIGLIGVARRKAA